MAPDLDFCLSSGSGGAGTRPPRPPLLKLVKKDSRRTTPQVSRVIAPRDKFLDPLLCLQFPFVKLSLCCLKSSGKSEIVSWTVNLRCYSSITLPR